MIDQQTRKDICGARTKAGTPCQKSPMNGSSRCRLHGGKSLKGAAHPNFKHGRYSKFMPHHLVGRYKESVNDPELLSLQQDIALLDARITEMLESMEQEDADKNKIWAEIQNMLGTRRKLVGTEIQRIHIAQTTLTYDQALVFLNRVGDIVLSHISNPAEWTAIANELTTVLQGELEFDSAPSGVKTLQTDLPIIKGSPS